MANRMDGQFGMVKETVYGTPVTVSRFYPYLDGTESSFDTRQRQGMSTFVSSRRSARGDRRVTPKGKGSVTIKTELASRQAGVLLEAATGVATSTLVSGTAFQQVFTTSIAGTVIPSYTIQVAKVRNDGTVDPETYAGCTAVSAEIECGEDGILTITVTFDALTMTTATALASATYTAGAFLFDHSQGSATVGGSLVVPTGIVMASGGTAFGNFRSWKLAWTQNADTERWVLSAAGRNQPTVGMVEPVFSGSAEYNDLVLRAAYLAGTALPVSVTHSTTETLSVGVSQLQVAIPQLFLDADVLPGLGDETQVVSVSGKCTFNNVADPFYIAMRTADTAL